MECGGKYLVVIILSIWCIIVNCQAIIEKCKNGELHVFELKKNTAVKDQTTHDWIEQESNLIVTMINDKRDHIAKSKRISKMFMVNWQKKIENLAKSHLQNNSSGYDSECIISKTIEETEGHTLIEIIEHGINKFDKETLENYSWKSIGCSIDSSKTLLVCMTNPLQYPADKSIEPNNYGSCSRCAAEDAECNTLAYENLCGISGLKGDKGDKGKPGNRGPKGERGPPGKKGDTGDVGPTGDKGFLGKQGLKGDTGHVGDKGPNGTQPPFGRQGDRGAQGNTGPRGDRGERGNQGPEGPVGPKMPKPDAIVYTSHWLFWSFFSFLIVGLITNITLLLIKHKNHSKCDDTPAMIDNSEMVDRNVWIADDNRRTTAMFNAFDNVIVNEEALNEF